MHTENDFFYPDKIFVNTASANNNCGNKLIPPRKKVISEKKKKELYGVGYNCKTLCSKDKTFWPKI